MTKLEIMELKEMINIQKYLYSHLSLQKLSKRFRILGFKKLLKIIYSL